MRVFEFRHGDPTPELFGAMLFPDDSVKRSSFIWGTRSGYFPEYFAETNPNAVMETVHRLDWKNRPDKAEVEERASNGRIAGQLFEMVLAIAAEDRTRASWKTAIQMLEPIVGKKKSTIRKSKERFMPVIHFWAAWTHRHCKFHADDSLGYSRADDLQMFMAEGMALLGEARKHIRPGEQSGPVIPSTIDSWVVPPGWNPPDPNPRWPRDGSVREFFLPPDVYRTFRTEKTIQPKLDT